MMIFLAGIAAAAGTIVYPWNAVTSIVKAGESFEVWFDAEPGQTVQAAVLRGPYNTVHISPIIAQTGSWTYDPVSENTYNTRLTVTVPPGVPADRYDLVVHTSHGQALSARAVKVIKEYKTTYKIFHISDSHLGQRGTDVLVPNKHTALVKTANIIHPDFVFNTGDVVYYHSNPHRLQERMDLFYQGDDSRGWKGMHDFNAATFVVAGNHDFQEGGSDGLPQEGRYDLKSNYWNTYHGLQYHAFMYGDSRFVLFNNGWVGYDWSWQRERADAWLKEQAAGGRFRILLAHLKQGGAMETFVGTHNFDLGLFGHNHHLGDRNPYTMADRLMAYYARSVRDHFEFCLFVVDRTAGTYTPLGYMNSNAETDGYGRSTASNRVLENDYEKNNEDRSVWVYNLTLDYAYDNNGTVPENTATLVNKFDFSIPAARVRFVMPKGFVYTVSQGTVYQAFDGDAFHVVDVDIDLDANSTTTVHIAVKPSSPAAAMDIAPNRYPARRSEIRHCNDSSFEANRMIEAADVPSRSRLNPINPDISCRRKVASDVVG